MARLQKIMIGHGMLVMLVGMLAGFMLIFKLVGGLEIWPGNILPIPVFGTEAGWVRAHSGGTMNGIMVIIIGLALPHIPLPAAKQKLTAWGFIFVAWSFTLFYWFGNIAGNRALTLGDNPLGETDFFGVVGVAPGLIAVFLVIYLLFIGGMAALTAAKQEAD
jgi:hypothetical protein